MFDRDAYIAHQKQKAEEFEPTVNAYEDIVCQLSVDPLALAEWQAAFHCWKQNPSPELKSHLQAMLESVFGQRVPPVPVKDYVFT